MIKIILMDCDGPIIKRDKYFSQRLMDLGIVLNEDKISDFFRNEFLLCETGKADLKEELAGRIKSWGWDKSLDELLDFWFSGEAMTDPKMISSIKHLRQQGVKCYLTTDQEKYRTEYLWNIVGLKNVLDDKFSSCQAGYLKRQPEFWEKICQDLPEYSKEEMIVWDDDQRSVDTAKSIGLPSEIYTTFEDYQQKINELIYARS